MATLHIEHPITDYSTWRRAFDGFAEARRSASVRSHIVRQPVDDARFVVVDLEFDSVDAATAFRAFLTDVVWANPSASPALAGTPRADVLVLAATPSPEPTR